jgi:extracellular solute-binding protein (family 5)
MTLLIVSESGPNNLDIHGVGTNVPGYEVSWNCYDHLISHEMKSGPGGVPYYDRDKFKPELAEDMKVGDMSVTFKLKKNAKFHDGAPVAAKDVKWSLDRAVSVGGFPTFQMGAGSLTEPEQFVIVDDNTLRIDFARKDRLIAAESCAPQFAPGKQCRRDGRPGSQRPFQSRLTPIGNEFGRQARQSFGCEAEDWTEVRHFCLGTGKSLRNRSKRCAIVYIRMIGWICRNHAILSDD